MAMRAAVVRLRAPLSRARLQARYSNEGRVLNEEERAQENLYIKKMERERLEKAKKAMPHEEAGAGGAATDTASSSAAPGASTTGSSKTVLVFAGAVTLFAVGWLFVRPKTKQEDKH